MITIIIATIKNKSDITTLIYKVPLLVLGLNQTLIFSLLPIIANQFKPVSLGVVLIALNTNLISHWIGSGLWGKKIHGMSFKRATLIAVTGYTLCHLGFIACLISDMGTLWLIALFRFLLGGFGSAFMPIAQTHHMETQAVEKLSKVSGVVTLGRVIGPALVLLPLSMQWILLIPLTLMLYPLFNVWRVQDFTVQSKDQTTATLNYLAIAKNVAPVLLLGVAITTLSGTFYIMMLSYLGEINQSDLPTSKLLAKMMLVVSAVLVFYQFLVMPALLKKNKTYPLLIIASLIITAISVTCFKPSWPAIITAIFFVAFALSGLPAWYSGKAFTHMNEEKSVISGLLAQAHTSGQLLGTGIASLFLIAKLKLTLLTGALLLCVVCMVLFVHFNFPKSLTQKGLTS